MLGRPSADGAVVRVRAVRGVVCPAVRGEERPLPLRGLLQQPRLDVADGFPHEPHHRGIAVVAQTGQVEDGLDTAAEGVADGRARAGERLQTVGEVLTAGDMDGHAPGEGGADTVRTRGSLGHVESGGEVDPVEAGAQRPVAAVALDHTGLRVAEGDGRVQLGERCGEALQHWLDSVPEAVVERQVGGVRDQQPIRFDPCVPAPLPGIQHRVPDVRVDPRTGQKPLMGVYQPTDGVPGDGQRDRFPQAIPPHPSTAPL
ncbi:hypothetical protein RB628_04475 [Streptomyces sp. ADMS]|uniref:hypothetical protein n=1 Tax=Streptomyces sp. ADMS TaxID=3071415 RepID=UPI00296EAAF3|nr:hypothetical protein [Streptomyces sp. ADMS]MDW4904616.1 hypothetical protein [Streptomyces sp. ADMS]